MTPAFVITTGTRMPGARLSCPGHWGNRPFACVETAEAEARRLGGENVAITRESGR
jgi:hypothetical protein